MNGLRRCARQEMAATLRTVSETFAEVSDGKTTTHVLGVLAHLVCWLRFPAIPMAFDLQFLVELPGIEPGSYGIPSRLLRAQFAMPLLGSPSLAN